MVLSVGMKLGSTGLRSWTWERYCLTCAAAAECQCLRRRVLRGENVGTYAQMLLLVCLGEHYAFFS